MRHLRLTLEYQSNDNDRVVLTRESNILSQQDPVTEAREFAEGVLATFERVSQSPVNS